MRHYLLLVLLLGLSAIACNPVNKSENAAAQASASAAPVKPVTDCQLTMGLDAWEPYQYMSVGNKVSGLDVELVQAVAADMGCGLDVVQGSWVELLALLKDGQVDFLMGASKTEERQNFALFSDPYRQERFQLFVRKDDDKQQFSDLKSFVTAGHKVGVVNEYYYGDDVAALYGDENLKPLFVGAIISELTMARLLDEEIDGMLEDSFVGASLLRRKGLDQYIEPHPISLGNADVYVMFSKVSVTPEQVQRFNQGLSALRANGSYDHIVEKYAN